MDTSNTTHNFSNPNRRADVDWLRVAAVFLLIPFHAGLIFVLNPNSIMYVKDSINSVVLDRICGFIHQFHMPLLFVISGMSTWFALAKRTAGQYLVERVKRLLTPLFFGILLLMPPTTYLTRLWRGETVDFWQHYLGFFARIDFSDLSGYAGTFTPGHLWFLLFLMLFSLMTLPLCMALRSEKGKTALARFAAIFSKPAMLLLLAIPLALAASVDLLGDKNPLYYCLVFILGFILVADERFQPAIDRLAPFALGLGIALEVLRQWMGLDYPAWSPAWLALGLAEQLNRWVWVLALLGFAHRWLNRNSKILAYFSEAAFPIYIYHMFFTTLMGFLIIQTTLPIIAKFPIIVFSAALLSWVMYESTRRMFIFQFMFGMKKHKR